MKQNTPNRISIAQLYFNLLPANPTFHNIEVRYKNRPVTSVRQGNAGSYYQVEVMGPDGREWLQADRDERVTVNVASEYSGRVELDVKG